MKCPKCQYLGFETSDRCKNCGYDYSLIEFRSSIDPDIRPAATAEPQATPLASWDRFDTPRDIAPHADAPLHDTTAERSTEPALPLFRLNAEDQPLVRLPVTPRRPLAVRRTPENPRLRTVPKPLTEELELDFPEEASLQSVAAGPILMIDPASMQNEPTAGRDHVEVRHEHAAARDEPVGRTVSGSRGETSSARRRCIAAVIDYALLLGIDVAIVYFTVRMAGLDFANWRMLPIVPLAVFLAVIALSYVGVFTAIGGQTIGKMAARIRVVPDEPEPGSAFHALRRTAAVMVSWLTGGLGFLTVLGGDHRALHDRLSRTRVVNLESA